MRKRINTRCVCSSANYEDSHIAHLNALERNHRNFYELDIKVTIKSHKYSEVLFRDRWISLPENADIEILAKFYPLR